MPVYRVYRHGELIDEPGDIVKLWQRDWVAFLIGCSFTFENALLQAGLPVRHIEAGCNVPMYRTNIACQPAGVFHGPMVVSMRPMTPAQAIRATQICTRFAALTARRSTSAIRPRSAFATSRGPTSAIRCTIRPGEIPVFWACGVTPQAVVMQAKPPLCVTHKPGHMFVTDWKDVDLEG